MNIISDSLKALEFDKITELLSKYAKTAQSRQLCLNLTPHGETELILKELRYTREAKKILDIPNDIPIEFVADINKIENSAMTTYLSEEELVDTAKTLRTSRLVRNFINENTTPEFILNALARNLTTFATSFGVPILPRVI